MHVFENNQFVPTETVPFWNRSSRVLFDQLYAEFLTSAFLPRYASGYSAKEEQLQAREELRPVIF